MSLELNLDLTLSNHEVWVRGFKFPLILKRDILQLTSVTMIVEESSVRATRPPCDEIVDVRQVVFSRCHRGRRQRGIAMVLAAAVGCVMLLSLTLAQEKTEFKEQGGEEEKKADADEEEDYVPEHDEVEEELGPFQIRRPQYKLVFDPNDPDPNYFDVLGLKRLSPIREVRKAFRDEARKYRDVLMKCNHPECFAKPNTSAVNATIGNSTIGNATISNSTAGITTSNATAGNATAANSSSAARIAVEPPATGADRKKDKVKINSTRKVWTPTLDGFKPLTEAYRVLSDPQRKRVYEVSGKRGLDGKYKPMFQDPLREPYKLELAFKTGTFKMDFGFKEGQSKNTGNVHHNIKIPMIGFYTGFHMDVGIVRGELCPHCNGTGAAEHAEMLTCPTCKGAGKEEQNSFWRAAKCPHARRRAQKYTVIHYVCMFSIYYLVSICALVRIAHSSAGRGTRMHVGVRQNAW